MTEVAVQAPETPESVNSFGRIFGVLFSPKETFQSIARKPTWLAPVVLTCILALAVVAIFGHRGGWRPFFEKQLENNSRVQNMPADQQARVLDNVVKFYPKFIYAVVVISPFVLVLISAAVFLGVFNGLMGTDLKFKTSLAVAAYALAPGIVRGLLAIVIVAAKDPSTVDLQNLVASNAAILLSDNAAKWLVTLMRSIDLFTFWQLILLAIGYHWAAPKKLSTAAAFVWIFMLYLVIVLASVGATAAFS